jgi:hypothetical protein
MQFHFPPPYDLLKDKSRLPHAELSLSYQNHPFFCSTFCCRGHDTETGTANNVT